MSSRAKGLTAHYYVNQCKLNFLLFQSDLREREDRKQREAEREAERRKREKRAEAEEAAQVCIMEKGASTTVDLGPMLVSC